MLMISSRHSGHIVAVVSLLLFLYNAAAADQKATPNLCGRSLLWTNDPLMIAGIATTRITYDLTKYWVQNKRETVNGPFPAGITFSKPVVDEGGNRETNPFNMAIIGGATNSNEEGQFLVVTVRGDFFRPYVSVLGNRNVRELHQGDANRFACF